LLQNFPTASDEIQIALPRL